ncbi:MAG: response regulator transcription factor [Thermoanaerobaculia bacterium]
MPTPKILIADDEPDVLESLEFRLAQEDYDVITASDGVEALGVARSSLPDLALLDVMMPRENGYRVSRMLREDEARGVYPQGLKLVLLTARNLGSDPEREAIFLEFSQADLMLYKPFDLEELAGRVEALLLGGDPGADPASDPAGRGAVDGARHPRPLAS